MKTIRIVALAALLALSLGALITPVSADMAGPQPFMPFSEIHPGMTGIGRTTLDRLGMKSFQIKVIGVVDNPGELNDYILIRSSGDAISKAGGYAQGMSGSPIYIDGKLIGAFFGAFADSKSPDPIGFVRPIETMLQLSRMISRSSLGLQTSQLTLPPGLVKANSPLYAGGLSPRAFNWLKEGVPSRLLAQLTTLGLPEEAIAYPARESFRQQLARGLEAQLNAKLYPLATMADQGVDAAGQQMSQLAAGRPVGLLFSNGDITMGFVCTTTYIDQKTNTLLTCGHQLLAQGKSQMLLAGAQILDTAQNSRISFVIPQVNRHQILGSILEDRFQGVAAALGRTPRTVGVTIRVKNQDTGELHEFKSNFIPDENLLASLLFSGTLSAVDQSLDRIGPGTMRITYRLSGDGLPTDLKRSDIFASFSDIAVAGPLQAAQVVFILSHNEFAAPKFTQIELDMSVTRKVRALQVQSIKLDKRSYHPGDTINYTVNLQPFRGGKVRITGSLQLPQRLNSRRLVLHAFGGPRRTSASNNNRAPAPTFKSLSELVKVIEGLSTNDQLTVELLGLARSSTSQSSNHTDVQHLKDWVLSGDQAVEVRIEPSQTQAQSSQQEQNPQPKKQQKSNCKQLFYC